MANRDKLLEETVDFTGNIFFLEYGVPGLVLGAIRNGETAVAGFAALSTAHANAASWRKNRRPSEELAVKVGKHLAALVGIGRQYVATFRYAK